MEASGPARWAYPHIPSLDAYVPGKQPTESGWTKLNTNELPFGPSPRVGPAVAAEIERLSRYPHPTSLELRDAIGRALEWPTEGVIIGNGSDDLLNLLVRVFGRDGVGQTHPSYSLYPVLTAIQNTALRSVELGDEFRLPVDELLRLGSHLLFLTSPNAPTGVAFGLEDIRRLVENFDGIVVVDEAYVDFAETSARPLLEHCPNLVITRTFSKSFGLAGLRVGYALANPEVIGLLDRVRDSYNVNRLSQAGALAAWEDRSYFEHCVAQIRALRADLLAFLNDLNWFTYSSQANFLFTRPQCLDGRLGSDIAADCFEFLKSRKVLVRYFGGNALTASFLRISIGSPSEIEILKNALRSWMSRA